MTPRLFLALLENETLKVLKRKRFRLILCIVVAILSIAVIGQKRQRDRQRREESSRDWRAPVERRIAEMERRLASRRIPEGWARVMRFETGRLRYHLEHDINPDDVSGPIFARGFAGIATALLLIPLLVTVFVSDLVSSEFGERTITLLLTRPVARWKILASKYAAMVLFTTLTLFGTLLLAWAISGLAFGFGGWGAPMLTGFRSGSAGFDPSGVRAVALWQDTLAAYGLAWCSALVVGAITMLLSVVFRSTAAAMGTMMATLIGGTILSRVASDWELAKWFFVTNLSLPDLYAGYPPPFPEMTLTFSVEVLAAWAAGATVLAFLLFTRRDVTN